MAGETPTPPEVAQQAIAAEAGNVATVEPGQNPEDIVAAWLAPAQIPAPEGAPPTPTDETDPAVVPDGAPKDDAAEGAVSNNPPNTTSSEGAAPAADNGGGENPDANETNATRPADAPEANAAQPVEAPEANQGHQGVSEAEQAAMELAKKVEIARIANEATRGQTPRDGLVLIGAMGQRKRETDAAKEAARKEGREYEPPKVDRVEQLLQQYEKSKDKGHQVMAVDYRIAINGYENAKLYQMMQAYYQQSESTDPKVTPEQKARFKADADKMKAELSRLVQQGQELQAKRTALDPESQIADPFKKLAFTMYGAETISSVEKARYLSENPLAAIFDKFRDIDWKDKDSGEVQQMLDNISKGYPKNEAATIQDIVTIMSGDYTKSEKIMKWAKTGGALAALLLAALAYSGFTASAGGRN